MYGIQAQGRKAGKGAAGENDNIQVRSNRDAIRQSSVDGSPFNKSLQYNGMRMDSQKHSQTKACNLWPRRRSVSTVESIHIRDTRAESIRKIRVNSIHSEQLSVDQEAGALGDLVIEFYRGVIGFVGLPVDATRAGESGFFVNCVD